MRFPRPARRSLNVCTDSVPGSRIATMLASKRSLGSSTSSASSPITSAVTLIARCVVRATKREGPLPNRSRATLSRLGIGVEDDCHQGREEGQGQRTE